MKILVVTQYFWPENFRVNDLVRGLRERGHQVTVLTGIPNYPSGKFYAGYRAFRPMRETYYGAEVVRVPIISRGVGSFQLAVNYASFALSASILGPLLCKGAFDRIFVHEPSPVTVGLPALLLKFIKKAPILFWVLDLWPESLSATGAVHSMRILNMVTGLVRFIYRGCDRVLVQSRAFIPQIRSMGVSEDKVVYFPSWAEDVYEVIEDRESVNLPVILPEGFRVMFAGNIGVSQDFPTILSAAEVLRVHPNIHWFIVGDGRMKPWVEDEVHKRGLEQTVHLLGRHPIEVMPRFFAAADVLLVTLKRDPIFALTIPGKVQSYLACGKPIAAALDGEGGRIVEESGAGITCSSESPSELARIILQLASLPRSTLSEMGRRGRAYYDEHFDRRVLLERLETLMVTVS